MKKRLLSAALAVCMLFGSAAALPEGFLSESIGITASAAMTYTYAQLSDGTYKVTKASGNDTTVTLPSTYSSQAVTAADGSGIGLFRAYGVLDNNYLTKLVVPSSYTTIGESAISCCKVLNSVTLNSGLTTIKNYAFQSCTALTSVTLPATVTSVASNAFDGCSALTSVNVASGNSTYVSVDGVVYNKAKTSVVIIPEAKTSVNIPATVTTIPQNKIKSGSLKTVTLNDGTTKIEKEAFALCPSMTSITIPASVTTIGTRSVGYYYPNNDTQMSIQPISGFTIYGYEGTAAETYAKNNNITFVSLGTVCTHTWGTTPSWKWNGYTSATATFTCTKCKATKPVSATISNSVTTAATCSKTGVRTYTASVTFNGKPYTDKKTESVPVDSNAHTWGTSPSWTWNGTSSATATFTCTSNSSHTKPVAATSVKETSSTPATCTTAGSKTYTAAVTFNGKSYTNSKTVSINALGHSYNTSTVAPTCTAQGYTLHTCTRCGYNYKDNYKNALGHIWGEWKQTKAPSCTADGVLTSACTRCSQTQTKAIAKLGHSWGAVSYTWSKDNKNCTAKRVCSRDSAHVDSQTVDTKYEVTKQPTTTSTGVGTYTATFSNSAFAKQTKNIELPKETLEYAAPTYTWSKDGLSCTAKRVCKTDASKTQTETVKASYKVFKAATCTAKGTGIYTASFKNTLFNSQTRTVEIAAAGHKWGAWKTVKQPTTTAEGLQERECSVCHAKQQQKVAKKVVVKTIVRFPGKNRYATAAEISKNSFKTANTVVLAYGLNYADALAGVPLAKKLNAPILLTNKDTLPAETLTEIKRLKATKVYVLGGAGAISDKVVKTLKNSGVKTVVRYAGTTRFGTAVSIAKNLSSAPSEVFFVYAFNYADALSVSTVAATKGAPIIYLKTNGDIDKQTADYLASLKKKGCVKNAYVIGGSGVISDAMMKKAGNLLGLTFNKTITRVAGKDRYATCVAVNKKFASTLTGTAICVAKGLDFPDALAGGVFAAMKKAPLFLADNALKDVQTAYLKTKQADTTYVFGGTGAVPDKLAQAVKNTTK